MVCKDYYLGLDIGTDSVGYAVTDPNYALLKYKGEPMWGASLFDAAQTSADRRSHRVNRRRIDRRQQRVALLSELFAKEIVQIDPNFFIRRKESALYPEDTSYGVCIFDGSGITDQEYHKKYPTIHHLILDLMTSVDYHDPRLVFLACAWLVANRGHFLFDVSNDNIAELLNFDNVYQDFCVYLQSMEYDLPWGADVSSEAILNILQMDAGVKKKLEAFKAQIYHGEKISKETTDAFPFRKDCLVTALSGGKIKPAELLNNEAFSDVESVSLTMNDEEFIRITSELGDEGEILLKLRSLVNCAQLISVMHNADSISAGKVFVYNQHKKDLMLLKHLVKSYCPKQYNAIFRAAEKDNYVFYTRNVKSCSQPQKEKVKSVASKDAFSDFLLKRLKNLSVNPADLAAYQDMLSRLEARTFLPKQKDTDNRVIPQQLYRYELAEILNHVEHYLPLLKDTDEDGLTVRAKILSIFDFKIPYYVGPLKENGEEHTWIVRKQPGKILPWNFGDMVDLDACEESFISRMLNTCTYLPGEPVLPVNSLLYGKFMVLNELNNLKVNEKRIPVPVKQELFNNLFLRHLRVTPKKIEEYLYQHGYITKDDRLSGLDTTFKANLKGYHIFRRILNSGILAESDVEEIINHAAYCEDKSRLRKWLKENYPHVSEEDVRYILRQDLKNFGRLSLKLLTGIYGTERDSYGEAFTIMEGLWNTNLNLMQLLSDQYTFAEQISSFCVEYYAENPKSLEQRLDDMYVSNAVKRPILRSLDILQDVVKANGCAPTKIFIEMARGGSPALKGKRTQSRKEQLLQLYKAIKTDEARHFAKELEDMGVAADNRLQSDRLFLYFLQMGRCLYTDKPIDLSRLGDGTFNIEHIYPRSFVKDDSILNNLILVDSKANGDKQDEYPVPPEIRSRMRSRLWDYYKKIGLLTDEKYRRLIRSTPFTDDEKMGFINRQLVETRQSTKALALLLKEKYPDTEIVYVKAGMVSEFRQEFDLCKSRAVNNLHHAKDAYLNIVVGNVYHERFTKKWFSVNSKYNVQVKQIFTKPLIHGAETYWRGSDDIALVKHVMAKNAVHLTRYAFCRKGGLFDQQPVKKSEGLVPLKKGLPTEKYGGYNRPTASFFVLARFEMKGKREIMIVPIELLSAEQFLSNSNFAVLYTTDMVRRITGRAPLNLELLLNGRPLKINTVFSLNGTFVLLSGKSNGGSTIIVSSFAPLVVGSKWERYIKRLESFQVKLAINSHIQLDSDHDHITRTENIELYQLLMKKMGSWPFVNLPNNQKDVLSKGFDAFCQLENISQVLCLLNILALFSRSGGTDLTFIGGSKFSGATMLSSSLSNWKKIYSDIRIVDTSASGLFSNSSANLFDLL